MKLSIFRHSIALIALYNALHCAPDMPLVITIHDNVNTVYQNSDCKNAYWKNATTDQCECCLINNHNLSNGTKKADDIIRICTDKEKLCTDKSLSTLKSQKKLPKNASSQQLIDALYDDVILRPMVFDTKQLNSDGSFTEQSLPKFLAQAYKEQKLRDPNFSKEACIKAKSLGTQGGYNTLQLFRVTSTCTNGQAALYIIKEARDGIGEATNLKLVENLPGMKDIIAPKVKNGFSSIAIPFAYFAYPDKQAAHYIAAMPSAKGKALNDIIDQFRKNQSEQNKETLNRAFQILGKETANFHKLFSKPVKGKILGLTLAHGDFHLFNLFFDEIDGHFTFIDNETMARSAQNRVSPSVDITKLFFMPFSSDDTYQQFRDLIKNIDLKVWHDIAIKNFALGYASAYPQNQQKQVLEELKKILNDPFEIKWVHFNGNQLTQIRKKYINPIFDELIKNATPKKK
jgi:hypothetical protein